MRISNIPHEESRIFKFIRQVSNNTIIYIFTALKEGLGLAILSHITVRVSSRRQNAALVTHGRFAPFTSSPPSSSAILIKASLEICISWTRSKRTDTIIIPLSRRDSQRESALELAFEVSREAKDFRVG